MERLQKPHAPFSALVLANPHAAAPRGSCPHVHGEGAERHPAPEGQEEVSVGGRGTVAGAGGAWELRLLWSLVLHKVTSLQGRCHFGGEQQVPGRQASSQAWL